MGLADHALGQLLPAPTRAWELLVGSLCAFATIQRRALRNDLLAGVGLALILGAVLGFDEGTRVPGLMALIPVGGTALVLLFAMAGTRTARLLSCGPFVGLGLVSYGAYLWHQPLAFARLTGVGEPGPSRMLALTVLSLVLAWVMWIAVEQPFRRSPVPLLPSRSAVFAAAGSAGSVAVAVGFALHGLQGLPGRLTPSQLQLMPFESYEHHAIYQEGTCFLRLDQTADDFDPSCGQGSNGLLIGDSHAAALAMGFRAAGGFGQMTSAACPPVLGFEPPPRPT